MRGQDQFPSRKRIVNATGGTARSWTLAFGLYGVIAAALFFITFKFCTERVGGAQLDAGAGASEPAPAVNVRGGVRSLVRNKYWLLLVLFGVLLFTAYSLMGVYPYYAKYTLGNEDLSTMLFTFRTVIGFGGVFLALPFISRIGKPTSRSRVASRSSSASASSRSRPRRCRSS